MAKKAVVITFGRFQPPTIGHEKLINAVMAHAAKLGAEHRIYAAQTFDGNRPRAAVKNPLHYKDKIRFMRQMFPKANIVTGNDDTNTFMRVLYELQKQGYQTVHVVVGDDRVSDIEKTVGKYLNSSDPETGLNFKDFKVVSAGKRDPEAEGVEGMSASKLRAAAADNDFKLFKQGVPRGFSGARELFDAIRKGLEKPMKPEKTKKKAKISEELLNEVTPPDEKSERFVKKAKESFKDRYGDDWASYLYGVAWKQYNKRHGRPTKTRLGKPIDAEDEEEENAVKENFDYGSYGYRIDPDGPGKFVLYVLSYSQGSVRFPDGRKGTVIGRFDSKEEAIAKAKKDAKSRDPRLKEQSDIEAAMKRLAAKALKKAKKKAGIKPNADKPEMKKEQTDSLEENADRARKMRQTRQSRKAYIPSEKSKQEAEALYRRVTGNPSGKPKTVGSGGVIEEAALVVPPNAQLVGISPDKKMVTMSWYDADADKWVEEEIPVDEMPGYFDRAADKLKIGKTDRFGNIKSKPITAKSEKKLASVAASNQKVAQELIDIVDKKPVGTVVTIYGKKQGKTDEYEMQIVKRRYMGSEVYTVKSSGRFVELRVTGAGLQIVDQKTKKILLDKGNDATW